MSSCFPRPLLLVSTVLFARRLLRPAISPAA